MAIANAKTLFARRARQVIGWTGAVLAFFFAWLQIKEVPAQSIINSLTPDLIWRGAIVAYYLSWVKGTLFDTDVQELVYETVPNEGKWPLHSLAIVLLIGIAAAMLCWTQGDIKMFALALTVFVLIDHIAWRYLIWLLRPSIEQSERKYKDHKNYYALEKLTIVVNHIEGHWKWFRLAIVGIPVVVLTDLFAFSSAVQSTIGRTIQYIVPGLPAADATAFAASTLVLLFVLGMESWIWYVRINTKVAIDVLDSLGKKYKLRHV
jgi:hypothetical protein